MKRQDSTAIERRSLDDWRPKTALGKQVKNGEIADINQIIFSNLKIKEPEVVDKLVPNLEVDFIFIGQAKGKFGGGKRRLVRTTQKQTAEGHKPIFSALAVVGNRDGLVGVGMGASKEGILAKEKAVRSAKLNLKYIARGCGSWKCNCGRPHSIPFAANGKCGSVRLKMMPAPKGTGLVCEKEIKKILSLAGYSDILFKSSGQTCTKINFVNACMQALEKVVRMKTPKGMRVSYGKVRT